MGAGLVEHRPRLEEGGRGELARAQHAEVVCGHGAEGTGSSIWRRQRVDVEDRDGEATQCQRQHQLRP